MSGHSSSRHATSAVFLTRRYGRLWRVRVTEVVDSASPEDGFEKFNKTSPDLILVDWGPDFDGLSLVQKIRNDKTSIDPLVPIIMVTPYEETSHFNEALNGGMTEFLSKPLSPKLLYLRIATVIENKRPFVRSQAFTGPDRRNNEKEFNGENRRTAPIPAVQPS
ncbi:MAG: response regulator [Alphaproteobacteria bacterium]|nr:response regulator [Alphaproteobacteria bacterium]